MGGVSIHIIGSESEKSLESSDIPRVYLR